jgi:signal peptidase I
MKKALKIFSNIITVVLFINLILMTFLVISSRASGGEPEAFGYQFKTVLSGSMEPTFKTGSVIAVQPVEDTTIIGEQDIITFVMEDGSLATHRVMEVIHNGENLLFQTKGDNNEEMDTQPVMAENVTAVYSGVTVPYLGYFIDFAKSSKGTALLLILPGLLLLGYSAVTIYQALKEIEGLKEVQEKEKIA